MRYLVVAYGRYRKQVAREFVTADSMEEARDKVMDMVSEEVTLIKVEWEKED